MFRAITFDLDDTLWEIWPVIARAEAQLHCWLAQHYPAIVERYTPEALRAEAKRVAQAYPERAFDRTFTRTEALRQVALGLELADFCPVTAFGVFQKARNEVEFFADVLPALQRLHPRYRLAAITNGTADIQQVGLGELMAFAINAADVGSPKPEPVIFQLACERLGLPPQQVVHVGDDLELDVLAAARVGMRTVWVNRQGKARPEAITPDAEISSLHQLEAALARLAATPLTAPPAPRN